MRKSREVISRIGQELVRKKREAILSEKGALSSDHVGGKDILSLLSALSALYLNTESADMP